MPCLVCIHEVGSLRACAHEFKLVSVAAYVKIDSNMEREQDFDEVPKTADAAPSPSTPGTSSSSKVEAIATPSKVAAKKSSKRKHGKELVIPNAGTVSELKSSYNDAKVKREETKTQVRAETTAIRNAKKKLDRVRATAASLSNKDLEEISLLRMQQVVAWKEKRERH